MTPLDHRFSPSFSLNGVRMAITNKSPLNHRYTFLRQQQNSAADSVSSRAASAAGPAMAANPPQIEDESAFNSFLTLPLPIHELIFDYTTSGEKPLTGQMPRGNQVIGSYFALKVTQVNNRLRALKAEIKKIDSIILKVSKKTVSLIGINREDHFGELSASSLDSPVKASKLPKAATAIAAEKTREVFHAASAKRVSAVSKRALKETTGSAAKSVPNRFAKRQQLLDGKEQQMQRLFYSALFCIRFHCENRRSIATALKDHLQTNKSDLLEAAFTNAEPVFYAAVEHTSASSSSSVYLLSPSGISRLAPERFLQAKEDDVLHVIEENSAYVIIPKQKQISDLLGTPKVFPSTSFEKAISGEL